MIPSQVHVTLLLWFLSELFWEEAFCYLELLLCMIFSNFLYLLNSVYCYIAGFHSNYCHPCLLTQCGYHSVRIMHFKLFYCHSLVTTPLPPSWKWKKTSKLSYVGIYWIALADYSLDITIRRLMFTKIKRIAWAVKVSRKAQGHNEAMHHLKHRLFITRCCKGKISKYHYWIYLRLSIVMSKA